MLHDGIDDIGSWGPPVGNSSWCRRLPSGMKGFCGTKKARSGMEMLPSPSVHRPARARRRLLFPQPDPPTISSDWPACVWGWVEGVGRGGRGAWRGDWRAWGVEGEVGWGGVRGARARRFRWKKCGGEPAPAREDAPC